MRQQTVMATAVGSERELSNTEFQCARCGIVRETVPKRLRRPDGKRRTVYCKDCMPYARADGLLEQAS